MGILRLLLAISVIVAHIGPIFGLDLIGGSMAVQSFFIISGFYMSMVINEKYVGQNGSFKLFISNRLLRIYPLYLVVLIATILLCIYIAVTRNQGFPVIDNYRSVSHGAGAFLFLVIVHLIIVGQDAVMFTGIDTTNGSLFFASNFWATSPPLYTFLFVQQAWSLSLEIMFYFIAPWILKRRAKWVLLLIAVSLGIRIFIYYYLNLQNDPWTYRFFPSEIFFFLLGYFSYRLYKAIANSKISWLVTLLTLATAISFTLSYTLLPSLADKFIFQYSLKDLAYFIMIVLSIPVLFKSFKNAGYDQKIGELSYPVYLSHLLIAKIVWLFNNDFMHTTHFIIIATILFSYILTVSIAIPIEKYRQKRLKVFSGQQNVSKIKSRQLA